MRVFCCWFVLWRFRDMCMSSIVQIIMLEFNTKNAHDVMYAIVINGRSSESFANAGPLHAGTMTDAHVVPCGATCWSRSSSCPSGFVV
ncbi:hypothetical protein F4604DRAFT_1731476, partial [Suillus subluteus]